MEAFNYKETHNVTFPPFSMLASFIRRNTKIQNDLGLMVSTGYDDGSHSSATKVKAPLATKNRTSAFTCDTRPWVRVSKTEVTGELLPQIVEQQTAAVVSPSENQHTRHRMEDAQQFCHHHRTKHPLAHCRTFKAKTLCCGHLQHLCTSALILSCHV